MGLLTTNKHISNDWNINQETQKPDQSIGCIRVHAMCQITACMSIYKSSEICLIRNIEYWIHNAKQKVKNVFSWIFIQIGGQTDKVVLLLRQTKEHLTIVVQIKVVLTELLLAVGNEHSLFSKEVLQGAHL